MFYSCKLSLSRQKNATSTNENHPSFRTKSNLFSKQQVVFESTIDNDISTPKRQINQLFVFLFFVRQCTKFHAYLDGTADYRIYEVHYTGLHKKVITYNEKVSSSSSSTLFFFVGNSLFKNKIYSLGYCVGSDCGVFVVCSIPAAGSKH